jgi:hypothetical protein
MASFYVYDWKHAYWLAATGYVFASSLSHLKDNKLPHSAFGNDTKEMHYINSHRVLYLGNILIPEIVFLGGTFIFAISQKKSIN